MSLFEKLKQSKLAEETLTIDGAQYLVKGLMSDDRERVFELARNKKTGRTDSTLGKRFLARCVCDPESGEPIQPDYREWNLPSHIVAAFNVAVVEVCGLDEEEAAELAKNSEGANDSD